MSTGSSLWLLLRLVSWLYLLSLGVPALARTCMVCIYAAEAEAWVQAEAP